MADELDLKRLFAGEQDLSGSDLSDADLRKVDLSGRNFRGADLIRSNLSEADLTGCNLQEVKFTSLRADYATFDRATISGHIVHASFVGASFKDTKFLYAALAANDFSEADFSGAKLGSASLMEPNNFLNAKTDHLTEFDGMKVTRVGARDPLFSDYDFVEGVLRRRDQNNASTSEPTTEALPSARRQTIEIAKRINQRPLELADMAFALARSIEHEIKQLNSRKPNEPEELRNFEHYVDFLDQIRSGLSSLASAIREEAVVANNELTAAVNYEKSASIASTLASSARDWLNKDAEKIVSFAGNTALLGAGTAFLTLIGAPAYAAFGATLYLYGGSDLIEAAKSFIGNKEK